MTRKYTKRSDYWENRKKHEQPIENLQISTSSWEPKLVGDDAFYNEVSTASYSRRGSSSSNVSRRNGIASDPKYRAYDNIWGGLTPFEYSNDCVNAKYAIELCQKAYYNIPIFRNSVDMLSDFTNSNLYLQGGSEKSRNLVNAWFKKVKINHLKDQFFRELYRSSNIFMYRIDGEFDIEDFMKIRNLGLAPESNSIPVRYILLNPSDIVSKSLTTFDGSNYEKILSGFELEVLKNPKTEDDKKLFNSFPKDVQNDIKTNKFSKEGVYVPIDPSKLRYCFYKKQDYEPFAVPFAFGVLDDINFKLEMKKIDQAICRTIENVVLLITMGTEPDKGGINPNNVTAMQQLFANQSVGRVLVSDYTTKMEFIIPDLKKVIGPEKYEVINQDIKEGLQNIIINQEKFANTEIKAQMFLQRLKEGRDLFLNEFLQPEIKFLCKSFGLKNYPTAKFETIDLKDSAQIQRVITRMMELGVLHPDDGIKVIETGVFPSEEQMAQSQKKFVEERKQGFYNPIVGGVPVISSPEQPNSNINPNNKTPKTAGRPLGAKTLANEQYSVDSIKKITEKTNALYSFMVSKAKNIYNKRKLNKNQQDLLEKLSESIVVSTPIEEWHEKADACLKNNNLMLSLQPINDILDLCAEHDLEQYPSALLYHSSKLV